MGKKSAFNELQRRRTGARSKAGKLQKVSSERLKRREQYSRQDKLLRAYASGKSLEQIALDEQLDMRVVVNSVSAALDRAVKNYSEPSPQHQFVRFAVFNMDLIRKLEDARKAFMYDPEGKQYSMIISSIRAQHEIYNSIQKKGLELGVIQSRKADSEAISGGKPRVLKELAKEAELLLEIVEEFDPHTQFKRRRRIQAKINAREAERTTTEPAPSNGRRVCAIVRKVVREHGIVVRDRPDEFFRKTIYEKRPDGTYAAKPKKRWTREDYESLGMPLPDDFADPEVIDAEFEVKQTEELSAELEKERATASTGTDG